MVICKYATVAKSQIESIHWELGGTSSIQESLVLITLSGKKHTIFNLSANQDLNDSVRNLVLNAVAGEILKLKEGKSVDLTIVVPRFIPVKSN